MLKKICWGASVFLLGACVVQTDGQKEGVGEANMPLVTFGRAVTTFGSANGAAETATLVNQNPSTTHKVVVMNLDDQAHITYGPTTRHTCSGASQMGWGWANPGTSDPFTLGRVASTSEYPILWGDPSVAQIEGTSFVFMANLAVPQTKMPASGCIDGAINSFLGGACIARSFDGGQTFAIQQSADCFRNATSSFYDGSAMAGIVQNKNVYAAFNDVDHSVIDVWRAGGPNLSNHFTQVSGNPFPGKTMTGHPRLAADNNNSDVYILAQSGSQLWLNYVSSTTFGSASGNWPILVASDYTGGNSITIGGVNIRRGAQYDLAIDPFVDAGRVAVVYSATSGGHAILKELSCRVFAGASNGCTARGTIDPGTNAFNPSIAATSVRVTGQPIVPIFQAAWSQQSGSQVGIFSGHLNGPSGGTGSIAGRSETGLTTPCPDTRGYWGDYNNHLGVYQPTPSSNPMFWTAFTDSSDASGGVATCTRQQFIATPQNVSATWINYP
jgi:hypothetical protein